MRLSWKRTIIAFSLSCMGFSCGDNQEVPDFEPSMPSTYDWELPPGVPGPHVPEDNPMSEEKVQLGRHLFYETRLSGNQTQSCGSCHEQDKGFADGRALPIGSTGETVGRNSQGLMNTAYYSTLTWMNPNFFEFSEQILVPIFGEFPTELGVTDEVELLKRFEGDTLYGNLFRAAYPEDEDPITVSNIVKALASFVRSMVSFRSAYDRFTYYGEREAMSASARRGLELFVEERLDCHHCHSGTMHFSLNLRHEKTAFLETGFANNGLYNIGGTGAYPQGNEGLAIFSGRDEDVGLFRTPTLRNIAVTQPYMHDGSVTTLEEVLEMYAAGGRNVEEGPNAGDGRQHPNKSEFVHGFEMSAEEAADLLEFLKALTDEAFLVDERFSNPFTQ